LKATITEERFKLDVTHLNDSEFEKYNCNVEGFIHSIEVGCRTGRPDDISVIDTERRFETRVRAFNFLSNYWNTPNTKKEQERRSLSPLRIIFEFQEEQVFDIPRPVIKKEGINRTEMMNSSIIRRTNITVSSLETDSQCKQKFNKNLKKRMRIPGRRVRRKVSAARKSTNGMNNSVIEGLSSILSELETEANSSSRKKSSNSKFCDNFTSALKVNHSNDYGKYLAPRKSTFNSTKMVKEENSKSRLVKIKKYRKNRPSSICYSQNKMLEIIKSLDELSSGIGSSC
jgi:hypothetical protein